ncbi:unnamed protein product [Rangifer tarandus platyrhynchus]|uniref:Uncharacterized protein n=2 Tax=Rangifer tarandus platyrhynchus TaxID=3082113 RepID=A0ACB0EPL5_RANTA|nr:unnamed protein product [Rangifer tarandus platyrhynchus]CAI9702339.1 unnamed protein product [Rangifer tarandus platyrhynchus]
MCRGHVALMVLEDKMPTPEGGQQHGRNVLIIPVLVLGRNLHTDTLVSTADGWGGPSVGEGLGPGGWESGRRHGPCSQRLSALHTDLHVSRPGPTHGAVTHSSEK